MDLHQEWRVMEQPGLAPSVLSRNGLCVSPTIPVTLIHSPLEELCNPVGVDRYQRPESGWKVQPLGTPRSEDVSYASTLFYNLEQLCATRRSALRSQQFLHWKGPDPQSIITEKLSPI